MDLLLDVVPPPRPDLVPGIGQRQEPGCVRALGPEASVERPDMRIVRGPARSREVQLDSVQMGPPARHPAREIRPVVDPDSPWLALLGGGPIEHLDHPEGAETRHWHDRERLAHVTVHDHRAQSGRPSNRASQTRSTARHPFSPTTAGRSARYRQPRRWWRRSLGRAGGAARHLMQSVTRKKVTRPQARARPWTAAETRGGQRRRGGHGLREEPLAPAPYLPPLKPVAASCSQTAVTSVHVAVARAGHCSDQARPTSTPRPTKHAASSMRKRLGPETGQPRDARAMPTSLARGAMRPSHPGCLHGSVVTSKENNNS